MRIRGLRDADLPSVRAVLAEWIAEEDDIDHHLDRARANPQNHVVAETDDGEVVGVIGLEPDGIAPELVEPTERAVEFVATYLRRAHLGTGVGRALADRGEELAVAAGYTTLIVVSGPRNREFGYRFWRRRYGDEVRWDDDYFGPGLERLVWRARLPR